MIVGRILSAADVAATLRKALAKAKSYAHALRPRAKNSCATAHLFAKIKYNVLSLVKLGKTKLRKSYLQGLLFEQIFSILTAAYFKHANGKYVFFHFHSFRFRSSHFINYALRH